MDDIRLKTLQQRAIQNVIARTSEANTVSMATRIGDLHSLHIAAYMDVDKTAESLKRYAQIQKRSCGTNAAVFG